MTGQHAIVIGGSLAGLLAVRALSVSFSNITLVERDIFPDGPQSRKGLPQAHHVHLLLWRGQQSLEKLFPGFQVSLEKAGAPKVDWIGDMIWFTFGKWGPRFRTKYAAHPCSRDLLEWAVRMRVAVLPGVEFRTECEVTGLLMDPDRQRVTGIRFRERGKPEQGEQTMEADLVVDASGRSSNTPQWLESLGFANPEETIVNSFLGYASRIYRQPDKEYEWKGMAVRGIPPVNKRSGVIIPIEDGRWMVTLAGSAKDYPPTDEAGFLSFAQSLPVPGFFEAIKDAVPLSPISGYRKTENRWRHYEWLSHWPDHFLVIGDATCGFNPVYGQGMTAAALYTEVLEENLRILPGGSLPAGWIRQIQGKLARTISAPWLLATNEDFRYFETEGRRPNFLTRLVLKYADRILRLGNEDPQVFETGFTVLHLDKPISQLFTPVILGKLLRKSIRRLISGNSGDN